MAIDAAVFDRPAIFTSFDGKHTRNYYDGMKRFTDYIHIRHIVEIGGVKLADNQKELDAKLRAYLSDPSLDREKRKVLVERECFRLDGKSTTRLAQVLINAIR